MKRIVMLVTPPRLPGGLLSRPAWECLTTAEVVCAGGHTPPTTALEAAGIEVRIIEPSPQRLREELTGRETMVWLAHPSYDGALARELGTLLLKEPGFAEIELMYGSWDPRGSRLLDVVSVVDQLAAPDGDPWLRQHLELDPEGLPTGHVSLASYLLEESYEAYDAIRSGSPGHLREELGDVLFQVVLHSRIAAAAQQDTPAFTIDDVAGDLVEKLIRRNPHVFGGAPVQDLEEISRNWERIKQREKARTSVVDGMSMTQPALALASQLLGRMERAGSGGTGVKTDSLTEAELGDMLFSLVEEARLAGIDPEGALRQAVLRRIEALPEPKSDSSER
jgi:XTP/dITP diphosphohydrolase